MSGDVLVHILGWLIPTRLNPVSPGQFWCFLAGFSSFSGLYWVFGFLGDLDETWNLQPLVNTSHSGLLIWTKGVLQGISGGALWVVR